MDNELRLAFGENLSAFGIDIFRTPFDSQLNEVGLNGIIPDYNGNRIGAQIATPRALNEIMAAYTFYNDEGNHISKVSSFKDQIDDIQVFFDHCFSPDVFEIECNPKVGLFLYLAVESSLVSHMEKITESSSPYRHLEKMTVHSLLTNMNKEDQSVPLAVEKAIPAIERFVIHMAAKMKDGGRLFYIGAGTSGRLGVLDASECPPTYGVSHDLVIGLMAGGDTAIRKSVEFAEDDHNLAWKDLQAHFISPQDCVLGIAASGTTPYVLHGLKDCNAKGITTASITCNPSSPISAVANFPIEVVVGPEFVTGSTRMKAGTAQKLVLNMISTSLMIQLGRVKDNRMVDMQLSNNKLLDRGIRMILSTINNLTYEEAKQLLLTHGSVRKAIKTYLEDKS